MKKIFLSTALAITAFTAASAQWEGNPAVNNMISPAHQNNYGYHIKTSDAGTTYLYTIVPADDCLDMRLQIVDKDGKTVLPIEGQQISAKKNRTYTSVGDNLLIDNKDNSAVIAVSDQRTGIDGYTIVKYNDKGRQLWSTTLDNTLSLLYLACMNMIACDDGGYMLAYSSFGDKTSKVVVDKLNADGTKAWDEPIQLGGPDDYRSLPYLVDAGASQAILVYAKGSNQDLYARLIDFDGTSVWGDDDILVYRGGFSDNPLHTMMTAKQAPDGGVAITWMGNDLTSKTYQNMFSVINNDGTYAFSTGETGTNISNDITMSRTRPDFFFSEEEQAWYLVYKVFNQVHQQFSGIFMQKMSAEGELLWGPDGKEIEGISDAKSFDAPSIRYAGNGKFAVFYLYQEAGNYSNSVYTKMIMFDKDGNNIDESSNITTSDGLKYNLKPSQLLDGNHFLLSYNTKDTYIQDDNKKDCSEIFMQWVGVDGGISTAISNTANSNEANGDVVKTEYFSATGLKLNKPGKGVNIIKQYYSNNTVCTFKSINK